MLNRRSPAYKELNLAERKLTAGQAIDLILRDPNLLRRPLVLSGRKAALGFDSDSYDAMF